MKKNVMMRVASALLVAVLLTTCSISGTFAKYVTQDDASDAARVAKWGVALQVFGNLYGETYKDTIIANNSTDPAITVQANDHASADDDVVAPGTNNPDGFHISLTGTPEVSTKVNVVIEAQNIFLKAGSYGLMVEVPAGAVTAVNFESLRPLYVIKSGTTSDFIEATTFSAAADNSSSFYTLEDAVDTTTLGDYYPVVYAMAGDTTYSGDDSKDTINEMAAALAAKFGTATVTTDALTQITTYTVTSETIPANTDLDGKFNVDDIKITWAWDYDSDDNASTITDEDKADTILGLLMTRAAAGTDALDGTVVKLDGTTYKAPVEFTDFCLDTKLSVNITVTQVD